MKSIEIGSNPAYIEEILRRYNFAKIKRNRNGFTAICPFHQDKNSHFSISSAGLWKCWVCGMKGNLKKLVELMGGGEMDWKETLRMMGFQLEEDKYTVSSNGGCKIRELPSDFRPYAFQEEAPAYVRGRLQWPTIEHYGLGRCSFIPNKDRVIIPIRFKDKVVGYHGRALRPDMQPRYYNPGEFKIKDHVFNYDECEKGGEVIVVEGAFNAMSMWEKGFKRTMAFFGKDFTSKQIERLFSLSPSSVVICFDRDPSKIKDGIEVGRVGQRAAKALGSAMSQVVPTYIMPLPMDKDPNDLPKDMLEKCYSKKVEYESLFPR
jgi:DNA primase